MVNVKNCRSENTGFWIRRAIETSVTTQTSKKNLPNHRSKLMDIPFINYAAVERMLSMEECISVLEETLASLADGDGVNPLRSIMKFPAGNGLLGLMPACLTSAGVTGIKVITVMPGNHSLGMDSHQGMVLLFEMDTGCPLAVIDAAAITAIRTAAASAVATRLLARKTAKSLAILGSGVQAQQHLAAMFAVRNIETVRIWSRNEVNARQLCGQATNRWAAAIRAHPCRLRIDNDRA